ncbi:histidine phosphotransferase family protein [Thalassovita taeanensis]|uniref:Histidine phosphotransferase ChpT n=1 Tax=Thalassovita taeanensis TaxID=657014 RepID=A0A1H8ZAW9_9RHOB|nr:histidine phosphotransferase family protein [Thalassovita taeanensis]SEP61595.1 histidine phosphotransferase ChpT [Thalassovita taeanensis]
MGYSNHELTALIGSRICHDLISPIGAIGNGLELMQMNRTGSDPELALISESLENANARIRFFRIAFGLASEGQSAAAIEVRRVLADLSRGSRLRYLWQSDDDCPRYELRAVFLALLCLETALPYGGEVRISSGAGWRIEGHGPRLRLQENLWQNLTGQTATSVSPAEVQFALLPLLVAEMERELSVEIADDRISLAF